METDGAIRKTPTVSRVADDTLVELVYDREKRTTGLIVSRFGGLWNLEQQLDLGTELLVPYSPRNNLIQNECVALPSMPVDYGDKGELLRDIAAYLHKYVDLSPLFEEIAAHYILMTWVYDAFNEVPYLRLRGDYGSGKTRALLAIGSVCYKGFFASGASTVSPIFHTLDAFGGTLILDEADFRFSDQTSELVKLLNNGNVRGLPVLRTMTNRHREFNPQAFRVFGPKIVAMRGSFEDKALESRFLTEDMGKGPLRSDIPIQLPRSLSEEALALRNRLLHYRLCHFTKTTANPNALSPLLEPRLNQTASSLLSVIDDETLRGKIEESLIARSRIIRAERRDTVEGCLIQAIADASTKEPLTVGAVTEAFNTRFCDRFDTVFTTKRIGGMLRNKLRLETKKSHGVYIIPATEKSKIAALISKYGFSTSTPRYNIIPGDKTAPREEKHST